jgi:phosphatidate phosphatase APP1
MAERERTSVFKRAILRAAIPVERGFDAVKYRLGERFDRDDPIQILPYRGYGTPERLYLSGRVLEDEPVGTAGENDSLWKNMANTWKRFESDEVPFARVRVRIPGWGWEREVTADDEGYFHAAAEAPAAAGETGSRTWHPVELELVHPEQPKPGVRATGEVMVPSADAEYGVISDIDDTVVETGVTKRLAMARTVFLGNARTRLPFKGVAAFYQALVEGVQDGGPNPIFFVSGSPWNLYDLLIEFMDLQSIPRGPLLLKDFGFGPRKLLKTDTREHKLGCIRPILDLYPKLPFLLIGDSGERDPEIYREVVREYPGRIRAIYIRQIGSERRNEEVLELAKAIRDEGVAMLLVKDTEAAAVHARESGWIKPEKVPEVQEEKAKDETAPSVTEVALAGETKPG